MIDIILIIGFPRSGTTWIANIFNASSKVIYRHEFIGREFHVLGSDLFENLKFNNGLTTKQHSELIKKIIYPSTSTDRPPFFYKDHLKIKSPKLHYLAWSLAKFAPFLKRIYGTSFHPIKDATSTLVMKETRSSVNQKSIILGIKPKTTFIIVRHPIEVAASHLDGIIKGITNYSTQDTRRQWYNENKNELKNLNLSERGFKKLSEIEFVAYQWSCYYQKILLSNDDLKLNFISYSSLKKNPSTHIKNIFYKTSRLEFNNSISAFIHQKNKKYIDSKNKYYSVLSYEKTPKWTTIMSRNDIDTVLNITNEILVELSKFIDVEYEK